jgi:hypothetical protein
MLYIMLRKRGVGKKRAAIVQLLPLSLLGAAVWYNKNYDQVWR